MLREQSEYFLNRFFLAQFTELRSVSQEIEQSSVFFRKASPGFRSSGMDDCVSPNEFSGKAQSTGSNFALPACLGCESQKVGSSKARWEDGFSSCCQLENCGRIGAALSKRGLTSAVDVPLLSRSMVPTRVNRERAFATAENGRSRKSSKRHRRPPPRSIRWRTSLIIRGD